MQMTSMFRKSCGHSAQEVMLPPCASACPPCCQLSGLKGRTVAPRSQITGQEQAMCSMQPEAFPNCPFFSPFPTLQSDSQSSFEVLSTKLFPMEWFLNSRENFFMKNKGYTTLIWWRELQPEHWRHAFSCLLSLI